MEQSKEKELQLLGQNIKRLRKAKGYNQTQLASKAKTRTATISEIENGNNPNPGWDLVKRVADVLGTSIHQLTQADLRFAPEGSGGELLPSVKDLILKQDEYLAATEARITLNEAKWLSSLPLKHADSLSIDNYVTILRAARLSAGDNIQ